jgi:hypothetical protein
MRVRESSGRVAGERPGGRPVGGTGCFSADRGSGATAGPRRDRVKPGERSRRLGRTVPARAIPTTRAVGSTGRASPQRTGPFESDPTRTHALINAWLMLLSSRWRAPVFALAPMHIRCLSCARSQIHEILGLHGRPMRPVPPIGRKHDDIIACIILAATSLVRTPELVSGAHAPQCPPLRTMRTMRSMEGRCVHRPR